MWLLPLEWAVVYFSLAGLGAVILPRGTRRRAGSEGDAFWAGACMAMAALQLLHFVAPVSRTAGLVLIGCGCGAALVRLPAAWRQYRRPALATAVIVFVFAVWAAVASLADPPTWDFGLYHLPAMRWIQAYPIVPGLANLHSRFGFNSSFATLTAALDDGSWSPVAAQHVTAAVLVLVLAAEGAAALVRLWRGGTEPSDVFRVFALVIASALIRNWLPTLSPDVAVIAIGYATAARLCSVLFDAQADRPGSSRLLILLALTGLTLKLSADLYFGSVLLATLIAMAPGWNRRSTIFLIAAAILSVGAWIAGTVVLTGFPLFPAAPMLRANVEWRVPSVRLQHLQQLLSATFDTGVASRLRLIWKVGKMQVVLPAALGALSVAAAAITARRWLGRDTLLLVGPAIAAAIAWFVLDPEPRLSGAIWWHFGAGVVTVFVCALEEPRRSALRGRLPWLAAALVLLGGAAGSRPGFPTLPPTTSSSDRVPAVDTFVTESGLVLDVPRGGDRCFDAPLPCTPYPDRRLALREPGRPERGFVSR